MQAPIQSSRPQSFDEIYGPPENFLEIEVRTSLLPPRRPLLVLAREADADVG